jgi:hypothetical protein
VPPLLHQQLQLLQQLQHINDTFVNNTGETWRKYVLLAALNLRSSFVSLKGITL